MNTPSYQQRVARFVSEHHLETGIQTRLLDLLSELGELAKEALKGSDYGRSEFSPTQGWKEEFGDAFFSLICLANSTGVNLEIELENALAKYQTRLAGGGDAGSGS